MDARSNARVVINDAVSGTSLMGRWVTTTITIKWCTRTSYYICVVLVDALEGITTVILARNV